MIDSVKNEVYHNLENKTQDFRRLFHGRGGCFEGFEFLTMDSMNTILFVVYFNEIDDSLDDVLKEFFKELYDKQLFTCVVLQRRYMKKEKSELLFGSMPKECVAHENGLQYHLNLMNNQNIGFFADMQNGRTYIQTVAKNKSVLNLFSYTCSLGVAATFVGASKVVNVDMSKSALSTGRANYHLNNLNTNNIEFMPYNILKSWSRIKKSGPYDIIIIDPPSFQKSSFAASKDYSKIVRRLIDLSAPKGEILACLNDPYLQSAFLIELFKQEAPEFKFQRRLENVKTFKSVDEEKSLKCLIFKRDSQ
ncbi:class I SAM-dependent methyltransferase [Candidatus Marinarcus aquaticus]|uniref:SAM-dependent methyltransferase n=1 Tax=Candidatus Marinarcus aquaticus TaxID=2044504 RepID=A0A4Q0XRE8_9BACT|nr:class I SAM-dependent methyltransferase [Candidatus Marinarcus aquaticus]RXJ60047.1 SAM-dependent methyltransferase [Candidatus Marinarcus aquaticus]